MLEDLTLFKSFLYRNFRKYEYYEKMLPKSDQPGQLYGTSKTHKFTKMDEVTVDNLKFRPIIAQSGAYIYNAAQVIVEYLKLLYSGNSYFIRNAHKFLISLKQQEPLLLGEE